MDADHSMCLVLLHFDRFGFASCAQELKIAKMLRTREKLELEVIIWEGGERRRER